MSVDKKMVSVPYFILSTTPEANHPSSLDMLVIQRLEF